VPAADSAPRWDSRRAGTTPATPPLVQQQAAQRAARRHARYDEVWALHRQGWLTTAIAAQVGAAAAPSSAICACPRGPYGSTAATTGGASSIPIRTISSRAGMLGATPPSNSFVSSNRGATPGAIAASLPMAAVSAQAQGVPPRRQGRRQTLPSWPSLRRNRSPRVGRPGWCSA